MRQMNFSEAIKSVFNKYATFSGRARRSEFWWFTLLCYIIQYAVGCIMSIMCIPFMLSLFTAADSDASTEIVAATLGSTVVAYLFMASVMFVIGLILLIPSISVSVRRLHDIGKSGWWLLLGFIPIAGPIVLLVWFCTDSQPGKNQWGANPKETTNEDGSIVA